MSVSKTLNIPLIDYLDGKLGKWWTQPEATNSLLKGVTYHFTHLELMRTGCLMMTNEKASTQHTPGMPSLCDVYSTKFQIELDHPEMPLFVTDDGDSTLYPAELITLDIPRSEDTGIANFTAAGFKKIPLLEYLHEKVSVNWMDHPEEVKTLLKNVNYQLSERYNNISFGSLYISKKFPSSIVALTKQHFSDWFSQTHGHPIEQQTLPLMTVRPQSDTDSFAFPWPAELISVLIR